MRRSRPTTMIFRSFWLVVTWAVILFNLFFLEVLPSSSKTSRCSAFVLPEQHHHRHHHGRPRPHSQSTPQSSSVVSARHSTIVARKQQRRRRQRSHDYKDIQTHLQLLPIQSLPPDTMGAAFALTTSSLVGMTLQKWVPSAGILGTLLTAVGLATAAFAAQGKGIGIRIGSAFNLIRIPTTHVLYDLCFSLFLPASLTLLLLAYKPPPPSPEPSSLSSSSSSSFTSSQSTAYAADEDTSFSIMACIGRTALPFLMASLASLLGCWLSFQASVRWNWFGRGSGGGGASLLLPWSFRWSPNTTPLPLSSSAASTVVGFEYARSAASVLAASYVGGSANAMATARLIGTPKELLGSLVTADLVTMALYFSFLSASLDWKWPRQWLEGTEKKQKQEAHAAQVPGGEDEKDAETNGTREEEETAATTSTATKSNSISSFTAQALASIPVLAGTYGLVQVANRIESWVWKQSGVPGTACAVLAIVAPLLNAALRRSQQHLQGGINYNGRKDTWLRPMASVAVPLSDFFFLSFFASLGLSVDATSSTLLRQLGPACLMFSTLALSVHVLGTLIGCWPLARWSQKRNGQSVTGGVGLEEAWIASNAAIGGPATAAAFCMNCMKGGRSPHNDQLLQGRTIAATV